MLLEKVVMMYRPEYDLKVIGKNLRFLREKKNLSVEDVRKYLHLGSVQAIYKYENGVGLPPADTMFALMELYGAELKDIIRNSKMLPPVPPCVKKKARNNYLKEYYKKYIVLMSESIAG